MSQKIQYYASDLSYLLDIGEIADMHVVTLDSGRQVLRIDCQEKREDEYKTVKTSAKKPQRRASSKSAGHPGPVRQPPIIDTEHPESIGNKLMNAGKDWMQRKDKPQFMRDAGF